MRRGTYYSRVQENSIHKSPSVFSLWAQGQHHFLTPVCGNMHGIFPTRDTLASGSRLHLGLVTQTWLAVHIDNLNLQPLEDRTDMA